MIGVTLPGVVPPEKQWAASPRFPRLHSTYATARMIRSYTFAPPSTPKELTHATHLFSSLISRLVFLFFFITLDLELSDTKVYEP